MITQNGIAGLSQTLGTLVTSFKAKDTVVAWLSNVTGGGRSLKAYTSAGTATVSNLSSAILYVNDSGFVVYGESGKVYSVSPVGEVKLKELTPEQKASNDKLIAEHEDQPLANAPIRPMPKPVKVKKEKKRRR